MAEMATQKDILDKFHNAGGSGGTAPSPSQCVTKGEVLSAPDEQTLGFKVGVSATDYKDNELCAVDDVSITKANTDIKATVVWNDNGYNSSCGILSVEIYSGLTRYWTPRFENSAGQVSSNIPNSKHLLTVREISVDVTNTGQHSADFCLWARRGSGTPLLLDEQTLQANEKKMFTNKKSHFSWNLLDDTTLYLFLEER